MIRNVLFFSLIFSTNAFCDESKTLDFEAELRALETQQLKTEEQLMRNVDAVSGAIADQVSDEISSTQAAPARSSLLPLVEKKEEKAKESTQESRALKPRRIRSRPF